MLILYLESSDVGAHRRSSYYGGMCKVISVLLFELSHQQHFGSCAASHPQKWVGKCTELGCRSFIEFHGDAPKPWKCQRWMWLAVSHLPWLDLSLMSDDPCMFRYGVTAKSGLLISDRNSSVDVRKTKAVQQWVLWPGTNVSTGKLHGSPKWNGKGGRLLRFW